MVWYFAYGSNLTKNRLLERVDEWGQEKKVVLNNYKIAFQKGYEGHRNGVANIIKSNGSKVYGVIYELNDEQIATMDRYEGVHRNVYKRKYVDVVDINGNKIRSLAYVLKNPTGYLTPTEEYLGYITDGLRYFGFSESIIQNIKNAARGIEETGETPEERIEREAEEVREEKILEDIKKAKKSNEYLKMKESGRLKVGKKTAMKDIIGLRTIVTALTKDPEIREKYYKKSGLGKDSINIDKLIKDTEDRLTHFDYYQNNIPNDPITRVINTMPNKPTGTDLLAFEGTKMVKRYKKLKKAGEKPESFSYTPFMSKGIPQPQPQPQPEPEPHPHPIPEPEPHPHPIPEPTPPPPPSPSQYYRIIVDSRPTREVHVKVDVEIEEVSEKDIRKDVMEILGDLADKSPGGIAGQTYFDIIINNIVPQFINYLAPGRTKNQALGWLNTNLSAGGIVNIGFPAVKNALIGLLINTYFGEKKTWEPLESIFKDKKFSFSISRPIGYLDMRKPKPIDKNTYTVFSLRIPGKGTYNIPGGGRITLTGRYRFTSDESIAFRDVEGVRVPGGEKQAKFDRWEIPSPREGRIERDIRYKNKGLYSERYRTSARTGIKKVWQNDLELDLNNYDPNNMITITAFYYEKAEHKRTDIGKRPIEGVRTAGYEGGRGKMGPLRSRMFQTGDKGITKKMDYAKFGEKSSFKTKEGKEIHGDPHLRAAINKGKRLLNRFARAEYTRIYKPLQKEFKDRKEILKKEKSAARKARGKLRSAIAKSQKNVFTKITGGLNLSPEDILSRGEDKTFEANVEFKKYYKIYSDYKKAYDNYFIDLKHELEMASKGLEERLKERAYTVSIQLARRFKIPLNSDTEKALEAELEQYASDLAEQFATRGRSAMFAFSRGIATVSRSMATVGDVWSNFLGNLWNIITGPWTVGTFFVLVQFFFISMYIGYHPLLLFWIPIVGAVLTFILNFEQAKQPLDWIGHLAAGAMISYAFVILFYSLGITMETMGGGTDFFIFGGLIFVLIGLFQFYQTGGFRTALIITIIALVFGYVALGPYSGYWQVVKDQIKTPLNMAWRAISGAVSDMWLLATNPTEWYARQQLQSVRPEKPIDFPKGVEVTLFDAIPPSVPAGQEFAVTAVFRNEGEMKAKDIKVTAECNQWCDTRYMTVDSKFTPATGGWFVYNQSNGSLERKEADTITMSHLVGRTVGQREAEFRMAKVTLKVSYMYHTSASLFVDVMHEDELQRLFREGKDVYQNVLAVEKVTPAKLSLNVGPQPLKAGTTGALLLLAISNTRDDGEIILKTGDIIKITLPDSIGSNLQCSGHGSRHIDNKWVMEYSVPSDITVKAYDFSSIFAILCSFDVTSNVDTKITGLITAELGNKDIPGFEFVVKKEKDVPITMPLGIFYDPFDSVCKKCGEGRGTCTREWCHSITKDEAKGLEGRCWYDSAKANIVYSIAGTPCMSCGYDTSQTDPCVQFLKQDDCISESKHCGFECKWNEWHEGMPMPVSAGGANIRIYNGWCEQAPTQYQTCSVVVNSGDQLINTKIKNCEPYFDKFKKYWDQNGLRTSGVDLLFVLSIAFGESSCNMGAQSVSGHGIMQIIQSTAQSDCSDIGTYDAISRDPDKNINCGTRVLYKKLSVVKSKPALTSEEIMTLTLFAYNRGEGAATRAADLMVQEKDIRTAMRDACYEFYDKGAYGNCAGLDKQRCCDSSGYGAQYPDKFLGIYRDTCKQIQGEIIVSEVERPTTSTTPTAPTSLGRRSGRTIGDIDFCGSGENEKCAEGGGGCISDNDCQAGLVCVIGVADIQMCCETRNIDKSCINALNNNYGGLPIGHRAYCELKHKIAGSESEQCQYAEGDCDDFPVLQDDECDESKGLDCISSDFDGVDVCCPDSQKNENYAKCKEAYRQIKGIIKKV